MFIGRVNNNTNTVNVNTKLFTSYSDTCMLTVGAWNTQLSLKFHPAKGQNADGVRQYAQDKSEIISTSLTIDNASVLLRGIKDKLEDAIKNKKAEKISIPISSGENKKILTLGYDGTNTFVSITIGVSEDGTAPETNELVHKFNQRSYFVGYDVTTGTGDQVVTESDYDNFVEMLKGIYDLVPTNAHSINYNSSLRQNFRSTQQQQQQQPSPANNFPNGALPGMDEFPF